MVEHSYIVDMPIKSAISNASLASDCNHSSTVLCITEYLDIASSVITANVTMVSTIAYVTIIISIFKLCT